MRNNLFTEMATEEFSFLLDRGFSLADGAPGSVCFQSKASTVCIQWDSRSGELEVYVHGAHQGDDAAYSLRDILAMEGEKSKEATTPFQVSDVDNLRKFLKELADDVANYAGEALVGDRMYFRRLSEFRSRNARTYMREMQLRQIRANADEAWSRQDYKRVWDEYSSMFDELSAAELRRLEFAKERL